ncbi:hypothetical protein PsorP6_014834 [Peronosclerospora sorghi]|uniref:Uncharacterized protein n=1 Tax=Peronosclerospora sorghi TaxID=230839 RepID=A0ACC0VRJ3_9STRA|nr:hypothetical protein PsorP6_014834 [Peronosclerospora sorghi]
MGHVWALVTAATWSAVSASSQFHLSLVGKGNEDRVHLMLDWVTHSTCNASSLLYGTSASALDSRVDGQRAGLVTEAAGETVTCWSALLPNLQPEATIYYAVMSDDATQQRTTLDFEALTHVDRAVGSDVRNFTVPANDITWAVFGDLGAPIQGHAAAVSLPALKRALAQDKYSGILNLGDLSYELTEANGQNYMDELEAVTSRVPMMTTVGNHEYQYGLAPSLTLQNYYRRFQGIQLGAGAASGSASNEFYSFTSGRIHFVFLNSEIYGDEAFVALQEDGKTWRPDDGAREVARAAQVKWLEYDLSRVERATTPFVVLCGHRPPFKTPKGLDTHGNRFAADIVPLLSKYHVDLYLAGHEHTYLLFEASTWHGYTIPPIIVSGSPGNNEYIRKEAELKIQGFHWKTLIPKYGYGYLTASDDALEWQWGSAASDATSEPTSAAWHVLDAVKFPKQLLGARYAAAGAAVTTPMDVAQAWKSARGASTHKGGTRAAHDTSSGDGRTRSTTLPTSVATSLPVLDVIEWLLLAGGMAVMLR